MQEPNQSIAICFFIHFCVPRSNLIDRHILRKMNKPKELLH